MTEQQHQQRGLPPTMLAALIQTARRRHQSGDPAGARALLHVLAAQQPDEPRVWLLLATVAETRDEQRRALEHVIALDPQNALALRGLARFGAANGDRPIIEREAPSEAAETIVALPTTVGETTTIAPAPSLRPLHAADAARGIRWPLYLAIGVAVAVVLVVAVALQVVKLPAAEAPTPTPALPGALPMPPIPVTEIPSPVPSRVGAAAPLATSAMPSPITRPSPAESEVQVTPIRATPSSLPQPTVQLALAPGDVVIRRPWHASLLRPEYALLLDGAIGSLQPRGRFTLALVAVGNDSAAALRIPLNLFVLVDRQGNRYLPVPTASTVYLDTYGRGQRGDLSMEEDIPPGGGNVSVPLIFDVPPAAHDLTLHIGDGPLGWVVGVGEVAPALTPTPYH